MNYNDISTRLARLKEALTIEERDGESKLMKTVRDKAGTVSFAPQMLPLLNKVHSDISALANMKDHLKKLAKQKGIAQSIVEEKINSNQELQLLIDLNNIEKHGTPLNKSRSGFNPILKYHSISMTIKGSSSGNNYITLNSSGQISTTGSKELKFEFGIYNEFGELVNLLSKVIAKCVNEWSKIIEELSKIE
tara:strand:- start:43 stop:618 length:576 start_codon:yes stop_codon:yes gene_type:complete